MFEITSFDEAVDRSWITFQHNLADHLSAMVNDDILILDWIEESTVDGFTPWMQFLLWDNEFVRAEVSSNAYLAPLYTLAPEAEDRLCALGWGRPTHLPHEGPDEGSPAFFVDKEQRWADQIAAMTVTTLREIWNVPHPSFLRTEMIGSLEGTDLIGAGTTDSDAEPEGLGLDDSAAIVPGDPQELRDLVARTVEQALGFPPELDEDGDVVLKMDDQPVFVISHPDRPLVRVWVPLLHSVAGRTRAAESVCDLTRRWPGIRFTLDDDRLNASIDISGNPFVPRHLVDALDQFGKFVPAVDEGFATRFGGSRFADGLPRDEADERLRDAAAGDEEDEGELPPALMTLLHLDPNGSGALSAHEVAAVCGHDRDAVLEYLKITKEKEISWRESSRTARAEDDSEEADVCDCEARVWAQTHESLRAALRVITLPAPPAAKPDQTDLFGDPPEQPLSDANTIEPPDHTARGAE